MKRYCTLLAAFFMASSCAQEQEPINRVQPNYVKKSEFEGLWYYGRTIVDVPAADGFTFVGDGSWTLKKVRFDIQENVLYIRRMTEFLKDGDDLVRGAQGATCTQDSDCGGWSSRLIIVDGRNMGASSGSCFRHRNIWSE